jgi:hypothetical protein
MERVPLSTRRPPAGAGGEMQSKSLGAFVLLTLRIDFFAYDFPMTRACLEWPQRGAKKRNDMMIILFLFCASCAFLWPFIPLVAASPRRVLVVN